MLYLTKILPFCAYIYTKHHSTFRTALNSSFVTSRYTNEFGHTSIRSASLRMRPRDTCDTCAFCSSPNATKYADKLC